MVHETTCARSSGVVGSGRGCLWDGLAGELGLALGDLVRLAEGCAEQKDRPIVSSRKLAESPSPNRTFACELLRVTRYLFFERQLAGPIVLLRRPNASTGARCVATGAGTSL